MAVQGNCVRFCHICNLICTIIYFNINIGNNNTSYTAEVATTSGSISDIIVSGEGELQVFDVMGHMVMNQHVNGVQTVERPLSFRPRPEGEGRNSIKCDGNKQKI